MKTTTWRVCICCALTVLVISMQLKVQYLQSEIDMQIKINDMQVKINKNLLTAQGILTKDQGEINNVVTRRS